MRDSYSTYGTCENAPEEQLQHRLNQGGTCESTSRTCESTCGTCESDCGTCESTCGTCESTCGACESEGVN
eukprot:1396649-Alexandrium_andersonii.AAC.1